MTKTSYSYDKETDKITVTQEFKIHFTHRHKMLLQEVLRKGYVELRGDFSTEIDPRFEEAFYDLVKADILEDDMEAWHTTGELKITKKLAKSFIKNYIEE